MRTSHACPLSAKGACCLYPNGQSLGLSKVARIVDMFAPRLQFSETDPAECRRTEICDQAKGVAVGD